MTPELALLNPLPPPAVQTMPDAVEVHRNGPMPVESPYARVGSIAPAFPMHIGPEQSLMVPSSDIVTD